MSGDIGDPAITTTSIRPLDRARHAGERSRNAGGHGAITSITTSIFLLDFFLIPRISAKLLWTRGASSVATGSDSSAADDATLLAIRQSRRFGPKGPQSGGLLKTSQFCSCTGLACLCLLEPSAPAIWLSAENKQQ